MEGIVVFVPGAVLALAYLLQPLVSEDVNAPWDRFELLQKGDSTESSPSTESESTQPQSTRVPTADSEPRQAMTDGGRVCHNCGSYVEDDYLYCAECLMPRV